MVSTKLGSHLERFIQIHGFFFLITEEPTALPPYGGTWYDDYDEYGMSMKICIILPINVLYFTHW